MFGLGGKQSSVPSSVKLQEAEAELDMVTDMFNKLVDSCHSKCLDTRYYDSDLSSKESLCLDRCVAKYFDVNTRIGEQMQKMGQSFMGGR